jgi:hypothetical protein
LFHTVESDIQQQRADHPTLGDPSVGGMPHVLFHVARFEPLFDQLPCWEITNGLDEGRMPDIIKCAFDVSV